MKNKKGLFKIGLMAFAIGCFGLSLTSATSFTIDIKKVQALESAMIKNIIPIHFADNGNNFGGFMYFSNGDEALAKDDCNGKDGDKSGDRYDGTCEGSNDPIFDEPDVCPFGDRSGNKYDGTCEGASDPIYTQDKDNCPSGDKSGDRYDGTCDGEEDPVFEDDELYLVSLDGTNIDYECSTRIKGFYYNAERGERLWPLDTETWTGLQSNLKTEGGIYTQCRKYGYSEALKECENLNNDPGNTEGGDGSEGGDGNDQIDNQACVNQVDKDYPMNDGYFGVVIHNYPEENPQVFGFAVGVNYNVEGNPWIVIKETENKPELAETFIRFNKQIPLGFVYDYNGGLGFAGCEIKSKSKTINDTDRTNVLKALLWARNDPSILFKSNGKGGIKLNDKDDLPSYVKDALADKVDCENIGTAADSLIKLIIEGLIGMNRESSGLSAMGNQYDTKMQYFSSADINNATLLNFVKQRSEILCRGKWKNSYNDQDWISSDVVCLENTDVSESEADKIRGVGGKRHTLIVKNGNVTINPFTDNNDNNYHDMFINNGNLIINETSYPNFVFTRQGFIDAGTTVDAYKNYLDGIFPDRTYTGERAGVGSFIRGNFVVDGHVIGALNDGKLNNKYFIYGKFTTRDSMDDLENTFAWRCSNGYVINKAGRTEPRQGKYCPPSIFEKFQDGDEEKKGYIWYNPYEGASLVVIDQNYDSPLYW